MNFKENLKDLIKDAHEFQYKEIGKTIEENKKNRPTLYFTKIQWAFIFLSLVIAFFAKKGFSDAFSGYIIPGLSLFVGMFFTFLITLYDKFRSIDFSQYHFDVSQEKYPEGVRLKNYFKKITVLSLYATIISILCICLLSINLLTGYVSLDTEKLEIVKKLTDINWGLTFQAGVGFIYKFTTLYFLLDFLLIAVYIISSFYDFMMSEYNQVKLKK